MNTQKEVGIREIPKADKWLVLSLQHLFAMFGATILVPYLVGLSPAVALVSSGLGTLAYLLITRGQVPAYLGSSFAFIAPIIAATTLGGPEGAMVGSFVAGLVYGVVALFIKTSGVNWLMNILPPIVVGPVIMVIGLGLAGVAVSMAMNVPGTSDYDGTLFTVALVTLGITVLASMFFKGFFGLIPILIGIVGGYTFAYIQGIIDMTPVKEAAWIQAPDFIVPFVTYTPSFSWQIIAIMVPIAVVTIAEHIGDQMVLSKVVGKNFIKKPGLHRSLLGDGVATMIASVLGGPPNTTYGENIGVIALTRVYSVFVVGGAACLAVMFGFVGKISALISTIPTAVMGGVSILLFGIIASSGLRMLIDNKIDLGNKRNLIISSVILVIGIGGAFIQVSDTVQIAGMALATIIGIVLNLVLPGREKVDLNSMFVDEVEEKNSSAA
ncbi:solute carrier family 23 protein [Anaerobacillus isosaccharinicus]|uniref:Uracil permease n=1 Tax=Anaerobacillus isosaccharinicus TaxID=1532552 RepID=A0A1S2M7F5_9BACI|nr:solute carrier family 23 protein [Anaerobacillus isosaccharinicus]MBA5587414.1 uracil permease [Anaerobacillus isosaccharinicus]QOY34397.1 uracil permease [Anaerobacillus isosaccharinicus]